METAEQVPFDLYTMCLVSSGRMNGEDFYERSGNQRGRDEESDQAAGAKRFLMVIFSSSEIYGDWKGLMEETA